MKTFVRVAEIWTPDSDGYLLEFGGGLYANAPDFGGISRRMCFGRGEGLPGRVWETRAPVILKDLQGGYFQRAQAAEAAGLTCAMAWPVYFGDLLKAVVVLFCGEIAGAPGALEVWRNDPRVTSDLTLFDGVYGGGNDAFEAASRGTFLPRGTGLPGLAWQREGSVFMDGVERAAQFVRGEAAAAGGLRRGLALPCPVPGNEAYVLTFLSAPSTPIARRIESWVAGVDPQGLKLAYGHDEADGVLAPRECAPAEIDPAVLAAYAGGVPQAGANGVIALPIVSDGMVAETVAMYF